MVRLFVMANYTDKFVLGYMNVTMTDDPIGPISFAPFENEIECYKDQLYIHHIPHPNYPGGRNHTFLEADHYTKDSLVDALPAIGATGNDIIFFADTDEFPTFETLDSLLVNYKFTGIQRMASTQFYYNFRREQRAHWPWIAPYFIKMGEVHAHFSFRGNRKCNTSATSNPNFHGIHLSYAFPTLEGFRRKLSWLDHALNKYPFNDINYIFAHIACGLDLYDRCPMVDRHDEFMKYVPPLSDGRLDFLKSDFDAAYDDLDKVDPLALRTSPRSCHNVISIYQAAKRALIKRAQSPQFLNQTRFTT